MSHLYLDESLDLAAASPGSLVELAGDEARHAVTVSRVRAGERIAIGDGRGTLVHGVVASTGPRELALEVDEVVVEPAASPRLILVQALAKGDRDELAVQAATELGVDAVVPWQAARSVSRWEGPRAEKGRRRWASIVREAVKQSIRSWVPTVAPVTATAGLAAQLDGGRMLLLEPTATTALTELESDGRPRPRRRPRGRDRAGRAGAPRGGRRRARAAGGIRAAHLDGGARGDRRAQRTPRAVVSHPSLRWWDDRTR